MATIVTRASKGSPLTNTEVDANFTNLNTDKAELSGATFTGEIVANAGIALGDNDKATFGASDDLQIYHDGSNSYIDESATGSLLIRGSNLQLRSYGTNEYFFTGVENGASTIYYDGLSKLATTATGIDVTGTATMDGLTVDGTASIKRSGGGTAATIGSQGSTNNPVVLFKTDESGNNVSLGVSASVSYPTFYLQNAQKNYLSIGTGGDISFYEDTGTTAKLFWDASAESLGIGTSTPYGKLRLNDSSGSCQLYMTSGNASDCSIIFGAQDDLATGSISYFHSDDSLRFQGYNNTERMRIDSSGKVGIGVSAPSAQLEILSGATPTLRLSSSNSAYYTDFINAVDSSNAFRIQHHGNDILHTTADGYSAITLGHSNSKLVLSTQNSNAYFNGNVGIGTSSPASTLEIAKNDQTNGATLSITNAFEGGSWDVGDTVGTINFRINDTSTTQPIRGQIKVFDDAASGSTYPYANAMSFSTGYLNTLNERMRIDSSGKVGIGTSSPASPLEISSNSAQIRISTASDSTNYRTEISSPYDSANPFKINGVYNGSSVDFVKISAGGGFTSPTLRLGTGMTNTALYTGTTEKMRIDASGNLLVGKTSEDFGTQGLVFRGNPSTGASLATFTRNGNNVVAFNRLNSDGSLLNFHKNGTTVGSIGTASTDLYLGSGVAGLRFREAGPQLMPWNTTTNTVNNNAIDIGKTDARFKDLHLSGAANVGSVVATGNVTAYSDSRLKENVEVISNAVSKVQQLSGNTYTRNDLEDTNKKYAGVIAQEVEAVLPEAVSTTPDGTKVVDYNATIALLVEAVKELKAEVDSLKGGE